jgi:hypothetical protein
MNFKATAQELIERFDGGLSFSSPKVQVFFWRGLTHLLFRVYRKGQASIGKPKGRKIWLALSEAAEHLEAVASEEKDKGDRAAYLKVSQWLHKLSNQ